MKSIKMSELKAGDVFTYRLELKYRQSYFVRHIEDGIIESISRPDNKNRSLEIIDRHVYLLSRL